MKRRKSFQPGLDNTGLERRTLMTLTPGLGSIFSSAANSFQSSGQTLLDQLAGDAHLGQSRGVLRGSYTAPPELPDTSASPELTGSGHALKLGEVIVTGVLHEPGFVADSALTGQLTLINSKGSITISIKGQSYSPFNIPTNTDSFTVDKGTGAYAKATGSGQLHLSLTTNPKAISGQGGTGRFIINFTSAHLSMSKTD